jgi:hypothetical protein
MRRNKWLQKREFQSNIAARGCYLPLTPAVKKRDSPEEMIAIQKPGL